MPAELPSSLASLLYLLRPCFTQPTFQTFCALVVGFLGRIRETTVTGMLQAAGLAGAWHHSRAHDFFARRRWSADELGLRLLAALVERLAAADAPLRLAIDDTLFGRSGRKVWGAHFLHDGAQPAGSGRRTRWGNSWVVVGLVVCPRLLGDRAVCLPVLFRLFRPRDERHPNRASQPELARRMVNAIARRFPGRRIDLVMDGAYASRAWRGLPERITVTTRTRSNAALHALAPPPTGKRGRPRLRGARLPSLGEIAERARFAPARLTGADGAERTVQIFTRTCLWYGPFHAQPVKVVWVRAAERADGFDVVLVSTDVGATAAEIIARYESRWTIETCFQEAKSSGVGEARNRVRRAVLRTVPFGFLCQTITIAWYALNGTPADDLQARRRAAPWYRQKAQISYADMLAALRRELIRDEYWAQGHPGSSPAKIIDSAQPPLAVAA